MIGLSRRLPQALQTCGQGPRATYLSFVSRSLLQSAPRPPLTRVSRFVSFADVRRSSTAHSTKSASPPTSGGGEASEIIFAADQPADLASRLANLSEWTIAPSKMGIRRTFTFPTFAATWRFMSLVTEEIKAKRHHPSWSNLYNEVTIEWTTHKPKGLSIKDIEMAEFCDKIANDIGLKQGQKPGNANSEGSSPGSS